MMIQKTLDALGFDSLNQMQHAALEAYGKQNDLILLSPTGSGKTVAFLLPMMLDLRKDEGIQTLILVPSRELALQIDRVFKSMKSGFRSVCCYGGHDSRIERNQLEEKPEVVIGTPGRILDHLNQENFQTDTISVLILDEFDKALELGFTEEMSDIIGRLKNLKKRVLTSATEGTEIPAYTGITNPRTLSFLKESAVNERLTLKQVDSPIADKLDTLYRLICELDGGSKLVFTNYRDSSARVSEYLSKMGINNVLFHGGMEQTDREKALARFRNGSTNVLVCTDLAARGLDIPEIKHIIHYHLPVNREAFVHRNGRTARLDKSGDAFLILGPEEYLPDYIDQKPAFQKLSEITPAPAKPEWITLYIGKGKKDKLSKGDIAGFLIKNGQIEKSDIGIIEVKEYHSFAAVKAEKFHTMLKKIEGLKIKNMKTRFAMAQ
ncbi:MAG: DEAD/DEAH box helicase [Bacteroidales bacterium]